MNVFQDLGSRIEAQWAKLGGDFESLPEAATNGLNESNFLNTVEIDEITEWLANPEQLPEQYIKDFGQPNINVFVGERFYIEILFWVDGTTAIHEHNFVGAFGVLSGSSVHSKYQFEASNQLSAELQVGNVKFISSEVLRRGDLHAIIPGDKFIHSLFHLDRPSVSVVVRSRVFPQMIQRAYLKPYVALDPLYGDTLLKVNLKLLDALKSADPASFWKAANMLLEHKSPWMAFHVLTKAYEKAQTHVDGWQEVLDKISARYGSEIAACFLASIKESERTLRLCRFRSSIHDADYRFFLGLVLNVPDREHILALVAQRCKTDQPHAVIMRWIKEMFTAGLFQTKLDSGLLLDVVDLAVRYGSFENARARVLNGSGQIPPHFANEEQMRKLWEMARSISAFQPLFQERLTTTAV